MDIRKSGNMVRCAQSFMIVVVLFMGVFMGFVLSQSSNAGPHITHIRAHICNEGNTPTLVAHTTFDTRGMKVIYSDDFESGLSGWGTSGGWSGLTTSNYHSASHSSTDSSGDYNNLADCRFYMTQGLDLSAYSEAYLSFYHYMALEDNWDGGIVEVSTDGGSSWSQLDSSNSQGVYDGQIYTGYGNVLEGKYAFCRDHTSWSEVTFDISSYCGQSDVRFAFHFGSDSYSGYGQDGWYIDDVTVSIPNSLPSANIMSVSPQVGLLGTTFSFNGVGIDVDGSITHYYWDFDGDGTWDYDSPSEPNTTYQYPSIGEYTPRFMVTDDMDENSPVAVTSNPIVVHLRPIASIDGINPSPALFGEEVSFYASGHDNDGDSILQYAWYSDRDGEIYNGTNPLFKTSTLSKGLHNISLRVMDEHSVWSNPVSAQLEVLSAPVAYIDSISPKTITAGESVQFQGHGEHEVASIVSYEWYSICGGIAELIGTSSNFTYNALRPGENKIYFRVQIDANHGGYWSAFAEDTVTVNPTSSAPTATITQPGSDTLVEYGTQLQLAGTGSGGSGTITEYIWGHFNTGNGSDFGPIGNESTITVSNLNVGVHEVYFQVKDSNGEWSAPDKVLVDVDRAPVITYHNPQSTTLSINEGESVMFNVTAFDPDYDTLRYTWYKNGNPIPTGNTPSYLFDTTGNYTSQGTYTIMVKVDDGAGRLSDDFSWTLTVNNVNQPPVIDSVWPDKDMVTVSEGQTVSFSVNASDVDEALGDTLTYQWYMDNVPIQGETSDTYHYYADYESEGRYEIRVNVTSGSDEISHTWVLKVLNSNRPPTIESYYPVSTNVKLNQDSRQRFSVNATDPDSGDVYKLVYLWYWDDDLMEDVSDDAYTLYCTPSMVGYHTLEVKVKDSGGEIVNVVWHINISAVNHEPQILSKSPDPMDVQEINEGESLTFNVTAYDPDDDTNGNGNIDDGYPPGEDNLGERNNLSFIWYVNDVKQEPVGHGNTGGTFTFQSYYTGFGSAETPQYTIKVEVTDGENSITVEWTVIVNDVNRPPVVVISSPGENERTINAGDTLVLDASQSYDPDNDTLTFNWYIDDKSVSTSARYEKSDLSAGDHTVMLKVSDSVTTTTETFTVRVEGETYAGINALITDFTPLEPKSGDTIKVTVKVENNGANDATGIRVALYDGTNEVDSRTIDLKGGESKSVTLNATARLGAQYTVQVEDTVLNLPVTVSKTDTTGGEEEQTIMGMNPRSFVVLMVVVVMIIVLIAVFGLIKFTEWKIEQEEMKRREVERARLASVSDEEAQRALEMEAAKAAMITQEEGATYQDQVTEDQYMMSEEQYMVEPSAGIYDPTGQLTASAEAEGLAPGEGGGREGLPPMGGSGGRGIETPEYGESGGSDSEINDIFSDVGDVGGVNNEGGGGEDELEDLFK